MTLIESVFGSGVESLSKDLILRLIKNNPIATIKQKKQMLREWAKLTGNLLTADDYKLIEG